MSLALTISPTVEFSSAPDPVASSPYNAVHNPILWQLQRKDFLITSIVVTAGVAHLTMTTVSGDIVFPGDLIYVSNSDITGVFVVTSYVVGVGGFIEFTTTVANGTYPGGFVNLNTTRKSFRAEVQIGMMDTGSFVPLVTASWVPNATGLVNVDVSEYLKPRLPLTNAYDYITGFNVKDLNLSKRYAIKYRQVWTGHTAESLSAATATSYITNSAKQIGDLWGGNMAEFVPSNLNVPTTKKAKFLSGFLTPHFWTLFPFDLSVIYSDVLSGDVKRVITPKDINGTAGTAITTLLNPAGRYYVNRMNFTEYTYNYSAITEVYPHNFTIQLEVDGVMTAIGGGLFTGIADVVTVLNFYFGATATAFVVSSTAIQIQAPGGHVYGDLAITNTDLAVTHTYPESVTFVYPTSIYPSAYYLDVKLIYSTPFDITETKRIVFETGCTKHPIYLAWKSKNGAWDYWLFDWNQTRRRTTGDVKTFEPYITDFAAARARIKTSSKTAVPSMVLGASSVPVDDVWYSEQYPGLNGLIDSVEVLMLMNPNTWVADGGPKWFTVNVKPGSFTTLQTKDRKSDIEVELVQPFLQLESQ